MGCPCENNGHHFRNPLEQNVCLKACLFLKKVFILKGDSGSKIKLEEVQEPQIDKDQQLELELTPHVDEAQRKLKYTKSSKVW